MQIFEWWYFKKYGTSFIEQVSMNHISPLLGGNQLPSQNTGYMYFVVAISFFIINLIP